MSNRIIISTFILSLSLIANLYAQASEEESYVGSNSTEATLEFNGAIQYQFAQTPSEKSIRKAIESQLKDLVGPMAWASDHAVPKGDHVLTNIKVLGKIGKMSNIIYHYKGTAVVTNGPVDSYNIIMPINPATIYQKSMVGKINPCTEEHAQFESSFWYYWSPERPGCKLVKDKDYFVIKAKLTRFTSTKLTYPEYQNLPDEKGNITIHVLFGMNIVTNERNPLKSQDVNSLNYKSFRTYLLEKGYTAKTWTADQIRAIAKTQNDADLPFVETIQKGKIIYRFFFGATGIYEHSQAFHWFYRDAIQNASIIIYTGHSGLGKHLVLDEIEDDLGVEVKFNTKRYQIFFFDSCTSYRYYNNIYFDRKKTLEDPKGTKKLDILTTGRATYFDSMKYSNAAIASALESAIQHAITGTNFVSYQTLAKRIDSGNLFGINGDEDNEAPTRIK